MTPDNRGPSPGDIHGGDVIRLIAVLVIGAIVIGIGFTGNCKRDAPKARWNQPPDPWDADPRTVAEERRREEEARRKFAEDTDRLNRQLDEKERRVRTFDTEDEYRDAVAVAAELGRDYSSEANRLGLAPRLRSVQQAAVRAASNIAKAKAVRLVGQDRYAAAARLIEELIADVGLCAKACGLYQEIEDLYQAYLFVRDVGRAAEGGTK
jgi:hypothetical protein